MYFFFRFAGTLHRISDHYCMNRVCLADLRLQTVLHMSVWEWMVMFKSAWFMACLDTYNLFYFLDAVLRVAFDFMSVYSHAHICAEHFSKANNCDLCDGQKNVYKWIFLITTVSVKWKQNPKMETRQRVKNITPSIRINVTQSYGFTKRNETTIELFYIWKIDNDDVNKTPNWNEMPAVFLIVIKFKDLGTITNNFTWLFVTSDIKINEIELKRVELTPFDLFSCRITACCLLQKQISSHKIHKLLAKVTTKLIYWIYVMICMLFFFW